MVDPSLPVVVANRTDKSDFDAIVVGGGHNGLICAAYLARAGVDTLLLEARDTVGGCSSTVDAIGARVNICNCDHVVVRSLPLREELDLDAHGLQYLELDPVHVGLSWGSDGPVILHHEVDRTLDALAALQPDQVDGYRRFVKVALPLARLLLDLGAEAGPLGPRSVARRLVGPGARNIPTLMAWSRRSAVSVLREYFSSDALIGSLITTGPAVWGVSPYMAGTGLGALRAAFLHAVPPGRPVGGSGALGDAVLASFAAAGGVVHCGAPVARLLVERDSVVGVVRADGTEHRAKTVIVACDPRLALLEWLDEPPAGAAALIEKWRAKPALDGYESKVDAVVADLPRFIELDEARLASAGVGEPLVSTVVVAPGPEGIAAAHRDAAAGRVARQPMFLVNVPSVLDASMVPPGGGHVFSLEVLFTPYALQGGWPGSAEPRRWLEAFASLVQPGWLDGLGDWRAMTPDRYEAEFSMPRGYAQSFAGSPLSALLGRDGELTRYRTPIGGLYLSGAATFPGAGVWGAPGRNTAHVVLGDLDIAPGTRPRRSTVTL